MEPMLHGDGGLIKDGVCRIINLGFLWVKGKKTEHIQIVKEEVNHER